MRFFKERRIEVQFVDLRRKPIAAGELRRFTDRLGPAALLDTESRAYREPAWDTSAGPAGDRGASPGGRPAAPPAAGPLRKRRHGRPDEAAWKAWLARGHEGPSASPEVRRGLAA